MEISLKNTSKTTLNTIFCLSFHNECCAAKRDFPTALRVLPQIPGVLPTNSPQPPNLPRNLPYVSQGHPIPRESLQPSAALQPMHPLLQLMAT